MLFQLGTLMSPKILILELNWTFFVQARGSLPNAPAF